LKRLAAHVWVFSESLASTAGGRPTVSCMNTNTGDVPAEGFDPTNGLVDGLQGDSDGTADGDTSSAAERRDDDDVQAADQRGDVEIPLIPPPGHPTSTP
jgi:hypothetical protein